MLTKLLRFGRRQLHTIVSREIIKPSSPTPSRNRTYNLSLFDQISPNGHSPIIAFYPNLDQSSHDKTLDLKNSLSKTLTQYYPFAGRLKKSRPTYVDCNDEGVEYIEAANDSTLSDFLQRSNHEDLDPLFAKDMWFDPHIRGDNEGVTCPLAIQVNRFACGGIAVASTLSHKVGDGHTTLNFINHWAAVNTKKDTSLINPHIISHQTKDYGYLSELLSARSRVGCVTKSFLFPKQKLNDLKAKVIAMTRESGQPIVNPTRVEALSWLIHNRAMAAANKKRNSGTFEAIAMVFPMDMRSHLVEKLPETSVGNLYFALESPTTNQSKLAPHITIGEMRENKAAFQSIQNLEAALEMYDQLAPEIILEATKRVDASHIYSTLYWFPAYDIDFGWGKPVKVTVGGIFKNITVFMAAPDGNGIVATVCLEKGDMEKLQNDTQLLAFS
ncbi:akuammiline synthase 1-like [Bidens hawaiensis]|uniref:akuammiline synthase 1-like n=1 Tax=Bidens hawaiensis TaxID=980011 RepID=UPI00404923D9